MKKRIASLLLSVIFLLTAGCKTLEEPQLSEEVESVEDEISKDTVKPVIRIKSTEQNVIIKQSEEYDLLSGVTGIDNADGDITDKIQINKRDYNPNVPGEYTIIFFLADSEGNPAEPVMKTIIVRDTAIYEAPPVYTGVIEGEKLNPAIPPVFGGAWYHKAVSSKDLWLGIEGTVTLPEVYIDRYEGDRDINLDVDPMGKNLDNPSVYMGGNALSESDVGLSLSKALIDAKTGKISSGGIVYRPFWRYITSVNQDGGGYDVHNGEYAVSVNGNNCIANYHWSYTEYYYLPGDTLRIIIYIPEPNKMQLQIEVIEKSRLPSSIKIREKYGWKAPEDFKSPIFHSPGHGTGIITEYKRVNAIDQVANEGKTAIPTQTEITNAVWHEVYLYRIIDGAVYRVPMTEERRAEISSPDSTKFTVTYENIDIKKGGEAITIHPGYSEK